MKLGAIDPRRRLGILGHVLRGSRKGVGDGGDGRSLLRLGLVNESRHSLHAKSLDTRHKHNLTHDKLVCQAELSRAHSGREECRRTAFEDCTTQGLNGVLSRGGKEPGAHHCQSRWRDFL